MFGLGSLLNGVVKGVGTVFGLSKAANAMNQAADIYKQGKKDAYTDRDRFINEDYTQRADAQRLLALTSERLKEGRLAADRVAGVMGGPSESSSRFAEDAIKAQADTAADIAVAGARRKDEIQDAFQKRKDAYDMAEAESLRNKAGQITKAISGLWDSTNNIQKNMG